MWELVVISSLSPANKDRPVMENDECNKTTAKTWLYEDLGKANLAVLIQFTDQSGIWYHKERIEVAQVEREEAHISMESEVETDP